MADQSPGTIQIALTKLTLTPRRADRAEAEHHLTELRAHHPARPAEERVLSAPRLRAVGRWLSRQRERASVAGEGVRKAVQSPRGWIGWKIARLQLLRRPTIGRATLFAVILFSAVAVATSVSLPFVGSSVGDWIRPLFLTAALTGAVVALWSDLVRLPYHAWRLRRRIRRSPWCVLPTTAGRLKAALMGREEEPPMVPRRELYEELLPGILDRSRRDIQLVVGGPGAGKTTALVGISELLARIGIVPVVVSLGNEVPDDLVEVAKRRFKAHSRGLLASDARLEEVWIWLREHRRVVVLADDMDRIAPDGERGFMVRRALNELAAEGLPAVVTARTAGIPAGLTASAIDLQCLDEEEAIDHVLQAAREERGVAAKELATPEVRGAVALWVREGEFAEVPFYLDLLARLVAARRNEELAPARSLVDDLHASHLVRRKADGRCEWNPLWVRFRLLERFYEEVAEGRVRRWLGIEGRERTRCLEALSEAALSTLAASALEALPKYKGDEETTGDDGAVVEARDLRLRKEIEEFLDPDDRYGYDAAQGERQLISAHEVIETGERLYVLDRDPDGKLLYKHRILQAYLAGRCLARKLEDDGRAGAQARPGAETGAGAPATWYEQKTLDWIGSLLDPRHPDRLTARMAITFAALFRRSHFKEAEHGCVDLLLERLLDEAEERVLPPQFASDREEEEWKAKRRGRRLDPRRSFDPEKFRVDPDDGLSLLTSAAEIAGATGRLNRPVETAQGARQVLAAILDGVGEASGATRWTKIHAIPILATLTSSEARPDGPADRDALQAKEAKQWTRIWEFARDPDESVRRVASSAMADDAYSAYGALEPGIQALLTQAALKSARDLPLDAVGVGDERLAAISGDSLMAELWAYGLTTEKQQVDSLCALGWVLPAIVSGLREQPLAMVERGFTEAQGGWRDGSDGDSADGYAAIVDRARRSLEHLVTLAFQRRYPELEASVARGFKSDALRHVEGSDGATGAGFVDCNRQLVSDICIDNAHYWYARLVLHQALALYTIAGSSPRVAFDTYGRLLRHGAEPHPFVYRTARQARRAIRRGQIGSATWEAFIWPDEGDAVSRRQAAMNPIASQLVADVTLLLNLRQGAPQDVRTQASRTSWLPYCLSHSRDRLEILGAGCPKECGCGLCPLAEAPVDEPDGKRTISRAFCRSQQKVARRHVPLWQQGIRRRALREFWGEMERRART